MDFDNIVGVTLGLGRARQTSGTYSFILYETPGALPGAPPFLFLSVTQPQRRRRETPRNIN